MFATMRKPRQLFGPFSVLAIFDVTESPVFPVDSSGLVGLTAPFHVVLPGALLLL